MHVLHMQVECNARPLDGASELRADRMERREQKLNDWIEQWSSRYPENGFSDDDDDEEEVEEDYYWNNYVRCTGWVTPSLSSADSYLSFQRECLPCP